MTNINTTGQLAAERVGPIARDYPVLNLPDKSPPERGCSSVEHVARQPAWSVVHAGNAQECRCRGARAADGNEGTDLEADPELRLQNDVTVDVPAKGQTGDE